MEKSVDQIIAEANEYLDNVETYKAQQNANQDLNNLVIERPTSQSSQTIDESNSYMDGIFTILVWLFLLLFLLGLAVSLKDFLKSISGFLSKAKSPNHEQLITKSDRNFDAWFKGWRADLKRREKLAQGQRRVEAIIGNSTAFLVIAGMIGLTYVGGMFFGSVGAAITFWLLLFWWIYVNNRN